MTTFEVSSFQEDVIEKSSKKPVLVDFWAPWCGPCQALGPTLEKLARENEDTWTLVKVNTDEHQAISQQYGIRGIPAVKLFVDGKVVDEFTGVLPEYAVKQWLEKALPSENKQRVEQAESALEADNLDLAETLLEEVLAEEPTNAKARILLAQILAFRNPDRAESLAEGASFAGPSYVQIDESVHTITRLMRLHDNPDDLSNEDGKATYLDALNALAERDFDTALTRFIDLIQANRYYDEDGARKACIALFTLLGTQHPATRKHRRRFDMALY